MTDISMVGSEITKPLNIIIERLQVQELAR